MCIPAAHALPSSTLRAALWAPLRLCLLPLGLGTMVPAPVVTGTLVFVFSCLAACLGGGVMFCFRAASKQTTKCVPRCVCWAWRVRAVLCARPYDLYYVVLLQRVWWSVTSCGVGAHCNMRTRAAADDAVASSAVCARGGRVYLILVSISFFCMWLMWVCTWLHQWHPLISPIVVTKAV